MEAQGLIRPTRNNPPSFGTLRQHGLDPLVTQRDMVRVSFFEPQAFLVDQPAPQPKPPRPSMGNRKLLVRYPWTRLSISAQSKRFHFD